MGPINVLISGTGSMGREIAHTINARDDMLILPVAFTGAEVEADVWDMDLNPEKYHISSCRLVKPEGFEAEMVRLRESGIGNIVAVEFGDPGTNNTELFAKYGIPWVSGTTAVDNSAMEGNGVYDVNMALPLMTMTHGLEALANNSHFQECLKGFTGSFPESHQLYKNDPSGTREKWFKSLEKMGASLDKPVPDRLEPEGHGYHKVFMHSDACTDSPLELWSALLEYAADRYKEAYSGFNAFVKATSNDDARPINRVLNQKQFDLGLLHAGPHRSEVTHEDTKQAGLANLYLVPAQGGAEINFKFNTHPERGTNAGFETKIDGRGIYMPGIMAAVKYVHEQAYKKGRTDMGVQSMMPVVKK